MQGEPSPLKRVRDIGPAPDNPEAAEFLKFWGEPLAHLRSFQVLTTHH
jgi:hypothetical protein